jgi:threonine 3-dehydrogenase
MTILVTGGTGFIGAQIVRLLVERGHGPVHVAHRSGNLDRLGPTADEVQSHRVDLADVDAVTAMVEAVRPAVIYHFGAVLSGPGEADPQDLLQANVAGTIALFERARLSGVRQIIFASSIGTYGRDLGEGPITDRSLQRPNLVYGVSKVFGENLGAYYRVKYGLDFRGLRYPSIIGPGVTTRSIVQYTSWAIEAAAKGQSFRVWVPPETTVPILYYKDAARAALDLAAAPGEGISSINYLVDGPPPTPSAGELVDAIRRSRPDADLGFEPDPEVVGLLGNVARPIDDSAARSEWGWQPRFDLPAMIDDVLAEVRGS